LSGQVLLAEQREAARERAARAAGIDPAQVDTTGVQVLISEATPWALATRPVSDLRLRPGILNERVSQLLVGEAVRVLGEDGEWSWIRMERDGYLAWVQTAALHLADAAQVQAYQAGCRHCVLAPILPAWSTRAAAGDLAEVRGKLPFGARVMVTQTEATWVEICLPNGGRWWVAAEGLLPVEQLPRPDAAGIAEALLLMRRVAGIPYMWGGRTPFGYDCSGLAGALWEWLGVTLKRDADQQFRLGAPVTGEPQPGDLLFFGEPAPEKALEPHEHITHVAIALGGGRVLHATGAYWATVYNSLDPSSLEYRPWLRDNLVGVRRYHNEADLETLHR
jgi:cell wall-associated NlpC family hydrolase